MKRLALVMLLVLLTPAMSYAAGPMDQASNMYTVLNVAKYQDFGGGSVNGFTFQVGYDLAKYLSVEGHVGMTNETSQSETIGANTVDTTIRGAFASLVARGNLRFEKTTVFGFVGLTYMAFNGDYEISGGTTGSGSIDESDTGATYGIGIDLFGNRSTAITIKAGKLFRAPKDDLEDVNATMIGITHYLD